MSLKNVNLLVRSQFTPRKMHVSRIILKIGKHCYRKCMLDSFDSLQSSNHTLAMADNSEGDPFLKTSKALIDVANGNVVLESNGEKIELKMIDKVLLPKANATNVIVHYLEKIGVDNLETILDGKVAEI
ncbi:putative competence-damage inducible protein, partial [Bienertia sinuspersici]